MHVQNKGAFRSSSVLGPPRLLRPCIEGHFNALFFSGVRLELQACSNGWDVKVEADCVNVIAGILNSMQAIGIYIGKRYTYAYMQIQM